MAGKSEKKFNKLKIGKLQINFTNRWLYTLIVFFSLVVIGVFVYATTPNPGHDITQIGEPSGCGDNQFLKWTGNSWTCEAVSDEVGINGSGTANYIPKFTAATTVGNSAIYETAGKVGIGFTNPSGYKLAVAGHLYSSGYGAFLDGIILGTNNETCSSDLTGMLRYKEDACDGSTYYSHVEICLKSGVSTYTWHTLHSFSYGTCDTPDDGYDGGYCFLPGTKVLMADGSYKEIQDIQSGDLVASYDLINDAPAVSRVKQLLIHPDIEGEYLIVNNKLKVTPNHRMWVVNRQLWQQMHFINIGDILLDSDGKEVIIYSIDKIKGTNTVYNLQLEGDYNNYFAEDILAHNIKEEEPPYAP